jgi:hypothetical protein
MRQDHQRINEWMEVSDDEYPETRREKLDTWLICYAPGHDFWMKVSLWWGYHVRRYPKPPPLLDDPVYQKLFGAPPEQRRAE